MDAIFAETKPEAVYFTETNGSRSAMIVNLENPSKVPVLAEPWFLAFKAQVKFNIVMSPEDLQASGIDKIGDKWD
jgi:hypothetical protein